MLNRSTTWAAALLVATFGAGVAVGVGGRAMWVRYASAASPERAHGVERLMGELDRDLRLTPVQRDSVDAILQRHYTRMSEAWETVRPAMVQARGEQRNAGASGRSAWGAFLPTVNTNASAARSNTSSFRSGTTDTLPPLYSYSGGLSASLVLFDGFSRFANLRAASASQDAAAAGVVNQRYQVTAATAQVFFTALANEELVRVAQAQVDRAKAELQTAVNKFQAGAATRSDTLTATVDLGNARLTLLQAQANLATAQANLGRQVGVDQLVRAVPDSAF